MAEFFIRTSQSFAVPSSAPVTIMCAPRRVVQQAFTIDVCSPNFLTSLPDCASHTRSVLSAEPVAQRSLSKVQSTQVMAFLCPRSAM